MMRVFFVCFFFLPKLLSLNQKGAVNDCMCTSTTFLHWEGGKHLSSGIAQCLHKPSSTVYTVDLDGYHNLIFRKS